MAIRTMSKNRQGFAAKLERQANLILKGEEIVGEELAMLNNALGSWMEEVSILEAKTRVRNEAQHQPHHERANIHEQVSTQMHADLGQTTVEMRTRNAGLEADLDRTKAEFTTYTARTQAEHKETRKEVTQLIQQREVDSKEWEACMAKAKERDELLTRQIAKMADKLKQTRMEQVQPAETPAEANMADEMELDHHKDPQEWEECQIQKMTILMMMKVTTEHLGPEGTLQGGHYQTLIDHLNHLMLNSGKRC